MLVLGIDPGLSGAAAVVQTGAGAPVLVDVIDIPVVGEGPKRRVNGPAFFRWLDGHQVARCHFERAQAMPDQGASSGFNYGRAVGALEAIVQCCAIPLHHVEASMWKKHHGLIGKGKEDSRQKAMFMLARVDRPDFFVFKYHHNRAEAALIALFGEAKLGRG